MHSSAKTVFGPAPTCRLDSARRMELNSMSWLTSAGLLDIDVLAGRIASRLHQDVTRDLINVTTLDVDGRLVVRATFGNRTDRVAGMRFPISAGIGGLAISARQTVCVRDYSRIRTTHDFLDVMVDGEGIRAAVAVPLIVDSQALGLLFLGRRGSGPISAVHLNKLQETSLAVAPFVAASMQLQRQVEMAVTEERQRLASNLHDHLIPFLFYIGATAARMREILPKDAQEAIAHIGRIEESASSASALARGAITALGSISNQQMLGLRLRATCGRFMVNAGIPVSVGIQGAALALDAVTIETLDAVIQESLNNVAKHAPEARVVVTLNYGPREVSVTVMDDGPGLPSGFEPLSINDPVAGSHYGLASLAYRLRLVRGTLDVETNEDGGVTVKANVPVPKL